MDTHRWHSAVAAQGRPVTPVRAHQPMPRRATGTTRTMKGVVLFCAFLAWQRAFSAQATQTAEVKTLFLNPSAFYEREVRLSGQIRVVGAGESWFVLEDGTGRLLVTTVGVASPTHCEQGARVALTGRLLSLGEEYGLYFAMNRLEECSNESHPWAARLARWLAVGETWPLAAPRAMIRP